MVKEHWVQIISHPPHHCAHHCTHIALFFTHSSSHSLHTLYPRVNIFLPMRLYMTFIMYTLYKPPFLAFRQEWRQLRTLSSWSSVDASESTTSQIQTHRGSSSAARGSTLASMDTLVLSSTSHGPPSECRGSTTIATKSPISGECSIEDGVTLMHLYK